MFNNVLALLLAFASFVAAAPMAEVQGHGNAWQYGAGGGVVGFIVLILDIIAFLEVLKSGRPTLNKLLWCVLIFLFPIGGLIIYYLFAERSAAGGEYEAIP